MGRRLVGVNERGYRVAEDHPRARLTDSEVELIRELHGEGMSYVQLAVKFETSKSTIAMICRFERRAEAPVRWKGVHVTGE